MDLSLLVDCRERYVTPELLRDVPGASIRQNDVGDFIILASTTTSETTTSGNNNNNNGGTKHDKVLYVIERKSLQDLCASVVDGRYKSQKERMISILPDPGEPRRVIYIIENFEWGNDNETYSGISPKAVTTIMYDLQVRHGFTVFVSSGPDQTLEIVLGLYGRVQQNPGKYTSFTESGKNNNNSDTTAACIVKPKKCDNIASPFDCALLQLCVVPRVSPKIARTLLEATGSNTLAEFVTHVRQRAEDKQGLAQKPEEVIEVIKVGQRAVGKALASRICEMLLSS
jgi:ERCC4-type nuclease